MLSDFRVNSLTTTNLQLVVVIPVYNEQDCIKKVLLEQLDFFRGLQLSFRILIVNDGSKDNTLNVLTSLSESHKELVIHSQENGGHGSAIMKGYQLALELNPDWIFQTDSDDHFNIMEFNKLWIKRNESDFILANRVGRQDPFYRILISRMLSTLVKLFLGSGASDLNNPFRLMKASFLQKCVSLLAPHKFFAPNVFITIIGLSQGHKAYNIPVSHRSRHTGVNSLNLAKFAKACTRSLFELIKFIYIYNHQAVLAQTHVQERNSKAA